MGAEHGTLRRWCYENARCIRHNVLHLRQFRVSYGASKWHVSGCGVGMEFPYYPYLAFHDVEGYLSSGKYLPRSGMTVIDVGGCYGEYSLLASKCVGPTGRVIMLEPDPANLAVARQVFEMNGNPANIEIYEGGLWSERGELFFRDGQGGQSTVIFGNDQGASNVSRIHVHSLQTLRESFSLDRIDIIKMDVEGAEIEILKGLQQLPSSVRPTFVIASYHIVDGVRTADTMPTLLKDFGYTCITENPRHLTTFAVPAAQ